MSQKYPLSGYALLADRPVSARRASIVIAVLLLVLPAGADWLANTVYDTIGRSPEALALLKTHADPVGTPGEPRSLVLVLVDGLRVDEASRLTSLMEFGGVSATLAIPLPTLSQPFYHTLLTGVPPNGTGVRRNHLGTRQRLDAVTDRMRSSGGRVVWIAEGMDWLPMIFRSASDLEDSSPVSLGRPLEDALRELRVGPPTLLVVHLLETDETAHLFGVNSEEHRASLEAAELVLHRVRQGAGESPVMVVSDHGHIDPGGHGGDEPNVNRAVFRFTAPGLVPADLQEAIPAHDLAAILAAWLGVRPPRSSIGGVPAGLAPPGWTPPADTSARNARSRYLTAATTGELRRLRKRRLILIPLALFLSLCGLGALKRSFTGLGPRIWLPSMLCGAVILAVHFLLWERPLSMSAIGNLDRHGPALLALGAAASLAAILATCLGKPRIRWRRSAASIGLSAYALILCTIAFIGGSLGPWPLGTIAYYLPILTIVCGAGACISASLVLLLTLFREKAGSAFDQNDPLLQAPQPEAAAAALEGVQHDHVD